MKKKLCLILALALSFSMATGCKKEKTVDAMSKTAPKSENVDEIAKHISPYTGEEVSKEVLDNIPVMAIIENSKDARPQSGLNKADIVYETMAEGGIPRFIALFHKNTVSKVGPIRSARAYFLNISKEYNLPFAHCGYSDEAKNMIEKEALMTMNEFSYGKYYWRDTERKAPHNLYTSTDKLKELASSKGYTKANESPLKFSKTFWDLDKLSPANTVTLKLNKFYTTDYTFKDGLYYKTMDGTAATNKEDQKPITAKNIVIQKTSIKLQADNQHLDINLVGQGEGYVISNGKYTKIKWSRKDLSSPTVLNAEDGTPVPLNPGNTWWHIIDNGNTVDIQ